MSTTTKTTVYLDADVYRRLRAIAAKLGRPTADLVREAVAEYTLRRTQAATPRSLGAGKSGRADLSERAEDLLEGLGQDA